MNLNPSHTPLGGWGGQRGGNLKTLMENKTTTELLDLLQKLSEDKGDYAQGGRYEQIMEVLKDREPFFQLLNPNDEESLPAVWDVVRNLQEEVKKLKRHKHDQTSGDVLIRI